MSTLEIRYPEAEWFEWQVHEDPASPRFLTLVDMRRVSPKYGDGFLVQEATGEAIFIDHEPRSLQ